MLEQEEKGNRDRRELLAQLDLIEAEHNARYMERKNTLAQLSKERDELSERFQTYQEKKRKKKKPLLLQNGKNSNTGYYYKARAEETRPIGFQRSSRKCLLKTTATVLGRGCQYRLL